MCVQFALLLVPCFLFNFVFVSLCSSAGDVVLLWNHPYTFWFCVKLALSLAIQAQLTITITVWRNLSFQTLLVTIYQLIFIGSILLKCYCTCHCYYSYSYFQVDLLFYESCDFAYKLSTLLNSKIKANLSLRVKGTGRNWENLFLRNRWFWNIILV